MALLTSAMAFESFIDSLLQDIFNKKGISLEAANVILESINNIYDKVYKLLYHLDGIKFKDYKEVNKNWQKLVEKRNKVAHGEVTDISNEEARLAFETVIKAIFYVLINTSIRILN